MLIIVNQIYYMQNTSKSTSNVLYSVSTDKGKNDTSCWIILIWIFDATRFHNKTWHKRTLVVLTLRKDIGEITILFEIAGLINTSIKRK